MQRLVLALLAVLALTVAACSSPSTSPSSAEASVEPSAPASEEASPSEEESPSEEATGSEAAIPSIELPSSAPELEDALPDDVGGIALQKFSMVGSEFMTTGADNQEFTDFLGRLDAQPDDVSVAGAFGFDATSETGSSISIFAFRVAGADTGQLTEELQTSLVTEGSTADMTETNIAGKDVLVGSSTDESTPGSVYLYGVGDIVFFIAAADDDQAAEVLEQLP